MKLRTIFLSSILIFTLGSSLAQDINSKLKWKSEVPAMANDPQKWMQLIKELEKSQRPYAMLSAGMRMMLLFSDVASQQFAFETIIKGIDIGYPNSLLHLFIIGNLELDGPDEISQNYNFYKAIVNKMRGMDKWSKDYFEKLDPEKFNKFRFYQAIGFYGEKKYKEALELLDKILKTSLTPNDFSFVKKIVRQIARIHFEMQNYDKSLLYYNDFLLRTNPITPTDWVEKSWNLFYLKRYEEALGTLYNMESQAAKNYNNFERFIIRASIYLNLCATDNVKKLVENFESEYKSSIDGIINGKQLSTLSEIEVIAKFSNPRYKEMMDSLNFMTQEREGVEDDLSDELIGVANYLFDTEIKVLRQMSLFYREKAINKAAHDLTMLNESLKFLQFGTEREKYNPAVVFRPRDVSEEILVDQIDLADRGFLFQWLQQGQFWRDERNKYKGNISNQCDLE
jgi:tetratricopeptide (TPR) repeat protein